MMDPPAVVLNQTPNLDEASSKRAESTSETVVAMRSPGLVWLPRPVALESMRFLTLFALVALAEMLTFFWLGSRIGLGWALGLALVTALVGSYLVRRAGLSVWRRISRKLNGGELPGRELSDGAAILVAGAFLISPGFITDTLGFLLLLPPVRDFIYRAVSKRFRSRVTVFTSDLRGATREPIQGEVIDIDPDEVDWL